MNFRRIFAPEEPPTEKQLIGSRRLIIAEGAVAAIIYSAGTGNLFMGYLSQMGASVSFCAIVAMIPQLGCVFQFFAPFLFERLRHRKLAVWICCVLFRLSLSLSMMAAQIFGGATQPLGIVVALYFVAFMAAGLVTPALQHMVLSIAPSEGRGAFFARKDIVSACVNSLAMLLLGKLQDHMTAMGQPLMGYTVIACCCLGLAVADAVLLGSVYERPTPFQHSMRLKDLMKPLRDRAYRPVLRYTFIAGAFGGLSSSFLTVYLLRGLGLSHTFITSVNVVAAAAAMAGSWAWGRYADRAGWRAVILRAATVSMLCTLGWGLLPPGWAVLGAPLLLVAAGACGGGNAIAVLNLQYACSPEEGKTTYIGVTTAIASTVSVLSATVSTRVQPVLEQSLGMRSIAVLFLVSALGGFLNLWLNARRLPDRR